MTARPAARRGDLGDFPVRAGGRGSDPPAQRAAPPAAAARVAGAGRGHLDRPVARRAAARRRPGARRDGDQPGVRPRPLRAHRVPVGGRRAHRQPPPAGAARAPIPPGSRALFALHAPTAESLRQRRLAPGRAGARHRASALRLRAALGHGARHRDPAGADLCRRAAGAAPGAARRAAPAEGGGSARRRRSRRGTSSRCGCGRARASWRAWSRR